MLSDFKKLIAWSLSEFSDLAWRGKRNLYKTLVSEIMLQQTTVSTVLNHYDRFLKQFPSLKSLAESSEEELLIAWKGLGYYRRAKSLLRACQYIHFELKGKFPKEIEKLLEIPGIGPYTASALTAIGRDEKALAVDANLERVLARYYGFNVEKGPKLQKFIREKFDDKEILNFQDKLSYRDLNEALMDLGRQYCRAKRADCMLCPLNSNCVAFKTGRSLELPVVKEAKKKKEWHDLELIRVIMKDGDKLLGYQKENDQWLSGQYEIPTFIISSTHRGLKQYPIAPKWLKDLETKKSYKTSITKYKITNHIVELPKTDKKRFDSYKWLKSNDQKNLSTASLKALKVIEK